MSLFKIVVIESNSNLQFVITAFELLKEKTISRITVFVNHISLDISLVEKLNSLFFFPQIRFRSKTPHSTPFTQGPKALKMVVEKSFLKHI